MQPLNSEKSDQFCIKQLDCMMSYIQAITDKKSGTTEQFFRKKYFLILQTETDN